MKQLIVVVEGMDNTGKTTLVRKLEPLLGVSGHMSNGRPQSTTEMFQRMLNYLAAPGISLHDRLHCFSDQVYGPIIRNENPFDSKLGRDIIAELKETDPLIIYCRPPREFIVGFGDGRDQMEGVIANARNLLTAYDKLINGLMDEGGWNIMIYDYTKPETFGAIKERIGELLNG